MERKKNCVICGAVYIAKSNKAKYCSKKCHDIAFRINHGIAVNSNPEPFHKTCKVCGSSFDTRREAQNTCSHECAIKWHKEMRHGRRGKSQIEKICVICGKTFLTYWNSQVTCGDEECKHIHRVNAAKIRYLKSKHKKQPKLIQYETRECKECGEIFSIDKRLNNVYCSADCRRKAENRKKDKRIPREQIVDTDISLKRLFKRDNGICWICGEKCDFDSTSVSQKGNVICGDLYPEIEHVVPISRGGLHSWANVRLAHHKCNAQKGADMYPYVPLDLEFAYKEKRTGTQPKKTAQYTLEGELVKIWESTAAIEREHEEWKCKHIQNVCRGDKSRTGNAYGYHWEYVKDDKCE